jgi:hypothetical protein
VVADSKAKPCQFVIGRPSTTPPFQQLSAVMVIGVFGFVLGQQRSSHFLHCALREHCESP